MSRRKYSDVEKAEAIAAVKSNGGNIFRTSQELKIPWATLADWVKNLHGINPGVTKLREEKEADLASLCDSVARKYLNQAGDEYVVFATPGNLAMTAAGIAIDKAQLLRGKPTDIHGDSSTISQTILASITDQAADRGLDPCDIERGIQLEAAKRVNKDGSPRRTYDPARDPFLHPEVYPSGLLIDPPQELDSVF